MTNKVYRSAQGKAVDIGALLLQNEQVRAVGNMNVNARGDVLDSNNKVIDQKNRQVQRHIKRQTNVSDTVVVTSTAAAKRMQAKQAEAAAQESLEEYAEEDTAVVSEAADVSPLAEPADVSPLAEPAAEPRSGLAAAIAKSRSIKQELEKTPRQRAQEQGLKKI
jgi:hypothetical protein